MSERNDEARVLYPREVERERSRRAWKMVQDVANNAPREVQKTYGTLARRLPSYLQTSGLGQTLAFLYAHSRTEKEDRRDARGEAGQRRMEQNRAAGYQWLLDDLVSRISSPAVTEAGEGSLVPPGQSGVNAILSMSAEDYRRASREAAATASWLKRFAEGTLEEEQ